MEKLNVIDNKKCCSAEEILFRSNFGLDKRGGWLWKDWEKKGFGEWFDWRWVGIDGMRDYINMISNVQGWERVSWKEWNNDNGWVERIRMDE